MGRLRSKGMLIRIVLMTLVAIAGLLIANGQVPVTTSTSSPTDSPPAPDLSKIDIPTVGFCDLVHNPEKYDNQIVRTQAIIYYGFEASVLYLPACKKFDTWAAYDRSYDAKTKESKKLYKILTKGSDDRTADVIIVGRFSGKRQVAFKVKDKTYYMGYGHMNMFDYQFTIMRVDTAKAAHAKP
jgi:hypothetical protein